MRLRFELKPMRRINLKPKLRFGLDDVVFLGFPNGI